MRKLAIEAKKSGDNGRTNGPHVGKVISAASKSVKGSFAERAGSIRGSVSGPRDLSTNPKYLAPAEK